MNPREKIKSSALSPRNSKPGCTTHPLIVGYIYVLLHDKKSHKGVLKPRKRFQRASSHITLVAREEDARRHALLPRTQTVARPKLRIGTSAPLETLRGVASPSRTIRVGVRSVRLRGARRPHKLTMWLTGHSFRPSSRPIASRCPNTAGPTETK